MVHRIPNDPAPRVTTGRRLLNAGALTFAAVAVVAFIARPRTVQHARPVTLVTPSPAVTHRITSFHGTGSTETSAFTAPAGWFVDYRIDCTGVRSTVTVADETGITLLDAPGTGRTSLVGQPGHHRLLVLTACRWRLTVYGQSSSP